MRFKAISWPKVFLTNLAILFIVLIGISNILLSLPFRPKAVAMLSSHYSFFYHELISIHHSLSLITGFMLVILSYRLYKRMRMAWMLIMGVLPTSLVLHILRFHDFFNYMTLTELAVILILLWGYKDFNRISDPITLRWGIIIASASGGMLLIYTVWGFMILKNQFFHLEGLEDSIYKAVRLLFLMDPSAVEPRTKMGRIYAQSSIFLNWACILASLILVLKPLVYQPIITARDKAHVRELLKDYGHNPISYMAVEDDKKYFFGSTVKGVIAYVDRAGVAVCAGDPISSDQDVTILLSEFVAFCRQNGLDICFCQMSEHNLNRFEEMGFGYIKYGEEAMFELENYSISGGKAAKLRQALNNATRESIEVFEYKPLSEPDKHLEHEIHKVSEEWLKEKKSSELSFMLGSIGLENPMDRRYFIAKNEDGIQGFIVFVPFLQGKGYYTDVTRRLRNAPMGVMEKIIIDAFEIMKNEGVKWGSMGLAPLANVIEEEASKPVLGRLLDFIYENMNNFYGFKTLHQYKKKYNPTHWEPRYMTFYPNIFTPKIAYAILKAQNPKGVSDFIMTQLKAIYGRNEQ